jgi:hypothetical protein
MPGVNIAQAKSCLETELNDGDDIDFAEALEAILMDEEDILNGFMLPEHAPSYIEEIFDLSILEGIDCPVTPELINQVTGIKHVDNTAFTLDDIFFLANRLEI